MDRRRIGSFAERAFGVVALIVGLSTLAAIPILQFLSLGYLLEASARVARSGRLRDGLLGVRKASRIGRFFVGLSIATFPAGLVGSFARSAALIEPRGPIARGWRAALLFFTVLTLAHILLASLRGGRLRYFLWPFGNPFWAARRLRDGNLYTEARDAFANFVKSLRLVYLFRLGLVGFLGTLAWIALPATLIGLGGRYPLLGVLGYLAMAIVAPWLPFLQVGYAVEGRWKALFARRAVRDRFRRAPWAFAFALLVTLTAAIPLYLLKIEMIPREAAWLPSLVFVAFLAPARLLVGWAYARSERRERPRHWLFRTLGRLAIDADGGPLRAGRLHRPVHVMGRDARALRAACLLAAGSIPEFVGWCRAQRGPPLPTGDVSRGGGPRCSRHHPT